MSLNAALSPSCSLNPINRSFTRSLVCFEEAVQFIFDTETRFHSFAAEMTQSLMTWQLMVHFKMGTLDYMLEHWWDSVDTQWLFRFSDCTYVHKWNNNDRKSTELGIFIFSFWKCSRRISELGLLLNSERPECQRHPMWLHSWMTKFLFLLHCQCCFHKLEVVMIGLRKCWCQFVSMITVMKLECYKMLNYTIKTILTVEGSIEMPVYFNRIIAYQCCFSINKLLFWNHLSDSLSTTKKTIFFHFCF